MPLLRQEMDSSGQMGSGLWLKTKVLLNNAAILFHRSKEKGWD